MRTPGPGRGRRRSTRPSSSTSATRTTNNFTGRAVYTRRARFLQRPRGRGARARAPRARATGVRPGDLRRLSSLGGDHGSSGTSRRTTRRSSSPTRRSAQAQPRLRRRPDALRLAGRPGAQVAMPSAYDDEIEPARPATVRRRRRRRAPSAATCCAPRWSAKDSSSTRTSGGTSTTRTGASIRCSTSPFDAIPPRIGAELGGHQPPASTSRSAPRRSTSPGRSTRTTLYWPTSPRPSS